MSIEGTGTSATKLLLSGVAIALLAAAWVFAYESYHDPALLGQGYCSSCHTSFVGRGALHTLHLTFTSSCDSCHTGSGRDNPLTMWSNGDQKGCGGCHGIDVGETIGADYRGFVIAGKGKASGYGLRKHHVNKGVTTCATGGCHTDLPQASIAPETSLPPYYGTVATTITGPCSADRSEDGTPEPNGDDTYGIDNDGDLLYDMADPDCHPSPFPGESAGPAVNRLQVTAYDPATGAMTLAYGAACGATDHTILYGALSNVKTYTYAGQACGIGATGSYVWAPPTPESLYFLVVGNDGAAEGSYGAASTGVERPDEKALATCPFPQGLINRCD